jgi:SEC-C motif-containing protein
VSKIKEQFSCPCRAREDVPQDYALCCGRYHAGQPAENAELLMRSRYSAYALAQGRYLRQANTEKAQGLLEYLINTWHPGTAPENLSLEPLQWVGLDVLEHAESDNAGIVEFRAYYKVNGKAEMMQEKSRFLKVNRQWLYIDALPEESDA